MWTLRRVGAARYGLPRPVRWALAGLVAASLLAAAGVIGYRVLAPAETLNPANRAYPPVQRVAPGRVGVLTAAPLIVDGRLRVYAEKRRVWADHPIGSRTQLSPYWAYRRWPAQLVGVVAVEPGPAGEPPTVVTQWSDGALVAIDAVRGRISWRSSGGPVPAPAGYTGRRTGAATVYAPPGLLTTADPAGRAVLVAHGGGRYLAVDPWSGRELWRLRRDGCGQAWTGLRVLMVRCGTQPGAEVYDGATGRALPPWQPDIPAGDGVPAVTPWGCLLGRSGCREVELRTAGTASQWSVGPDGRVRPDPLAHQASEFVIGDAAVVEHRADSYVALLDRATGRPRWQAPIDGYVALADETGVYVIGRYRLSVLSPADGVQRELLDLRGTETRDWRAGHVYRAGRMVAIERVTGSPRDPDDKYLYGLTPMVLVAL